MSKPKFNIPDYSPDQELLLAKILEEDMHLDRSFWDGLTAHEKQWAIDSLHQVSDSLKLNALWEYDYKWLPVSIQEAMDANYIDELGVETNYYFGPDFKHLYPFWKTELGLTLSPDSHIFEHLATGSIGGGKTTFAVFANAFKLYELSCLRNPHSYYRLMSSAPIVFSLFNVTKERADLSAYTMLKGLVNSAPYFRENFPIDKRRVIDDAADDDLKYAIKLPNNIKIILGSRPNSAISTNVIGGILDEVNFKELKTVKNTEGKTGTQAFQVYTNVLKRIMSRFAADKRKLPGILCNVSSRQSTTDFLEEHIKTIESEDANCTCTDLPHVCGGKKTRITVASIYKMKPAGTYSTKMFRVQIGSKTTGHKLLPEGQPPADGCEVEEVPVDFLQAFKDDIDGAIRDICGMATYGNQPFIRDREKVMDCVSKTRINPFPASVPLYNQMSKAADGSFVDSAPSLEDYLHKEVMLQHYGTGYRLRNFPTHQRFIHADLSLTGDCTGFAMGCISSMAKVKRQNRDGSVSELVVPKIWIDFMVRIVPTEGYEIDYSKIRQFIYTLRDIYNVPVKQVSTDTFQSSDLRQQLMKEGIDTKVISMDTPRDDNPLAVRMALYEGRVDMPYYDPFLSEIADLYHDKVKRKVDHRQGKSKDVFDAFGGVVCAIGQEEDPDTLIEASQEAGGAIMPVVKGAAQSTDSFIKQEQVFGDCLTRQED